MAQLAVTDSVQGVQTTRFFWGAATSAFQVEGATSEDGRGESIWDRFCQTPGKIATGETGDPACDHYHRWPEDVATMQRLGLNAYRFSVAWPRILPEGRGQPNEKGLDFYDRLVDALLAAGITPWLTLYHWDLPQPLEDLGGWPDRDTAQAFAEFAALVACRLGDRVKHWITLNEPLCSAFRGYHTGVQAPGRASLSDALQAAHSLLLGHGLATSAVRASHPESEVGLTTVLMPVYPASDRPEDGAAARRFDGYFNRWFLDPLYGRGYPADMFELYQGVAPTIASGDFETIGQPLDFLGVNYYDPGFIAADPGAPFLGFREVPMPGAETTGMGWSVFPQGLEDILLRVWCDYAPKSIAITENGAAFPDTLDGDAVHDSARTRFLAGHIDAALRAKAAGVPLNGYFVWSLLDNFEWAYGTSKRFGLVYTDFPTQRRFIKDSGLWYGQFIASALAASRNP